MSLTELLNEGKPSNRVDKVELALSKLTPEQLDVFKTVITDRTFTSAGIAAALTEDAGMELKEHQVRHFRRKLREGSVTL